MRALAAAAVVLAAVAALWWLTVRTQGATCEACVVFEGRSACRAASADDREEAARHAQATACALVTAGVTEDLACQRTPPKTLVCE